MASRPKRQAKRAAELFRAIAGLDELILEYCPSDYYRVPKPANHRDSRWGHWLAVIAGVDQAAAAIWSLAADLHQRAGLPWPPPEPAVGAQTTDEEAAP